MDMKLLHQKFCKETFGPTGVIEKFEPVYGEDFNFAYDVIDAIAKEEPARRAMVWCNVAGEKRTFTFGEMADYASRAARLFLDHGIRRGDRVMLVLKRHYQFWPAILGLHKIGAIAIPATHLLTSTGLRAPASRRLWLPPRTIPPPTSRRRWHPTPA